MSNFIYIDTDNFRDERAPAWAGLYHDLIGTFERQSIADDVTGAVYRMLQRKSPRPELYFVRTDMGDDVYILHVHIFARIEIGWARDRPTPFERALPLARVVNPAPLEILRDDRRFLADLKISSPINP